MFKKLYNLFVFLVLALCAPWVLAQTELTVSASPANPTTQDTVTLTVGVSGNTGPVQASRVEYFNGTTSMGVVNGGYQLVLNGIPAGTHVITAVATLTEPEGAQLTSPPLALTVQATGNSGTYFIHADQLNTPRVITAQNGAEVWRWDSDPFGSAPPNEQPAGQAQFAFNQRFPGQYFDRETNLHYNYYRDYDPALGRYIQSDPIGLLGGLNTFSYVQGNPLSFADPSGLCIGPAFAACVIIAENTPAILAVTSTVVGIATGAEVPGPVGAANVGARTIAQQAGKILSFPNWGAARSALGNRPNEAIHHIVEQCQALSHRSGFSQKLINSTNNMIRLDAATHDKISAYYSSKPIGATRTVRDAMNGRSFEEQYEFGMKVVERALAGKL